MGAEQRPGLLTFDPRRQSEFVFRSFGENTAPAPS